MLLAAEQNRYNPVLDTIHQTKWDGEKRVGTTWTRFLKAPDTTYIRELETLFFVAAIARLYEPGHPFHLVPIFGGTEGGGKTGYIKAIAFDSKFFRELSGDFHNHPEDGGVHSLGLDHGDARTQGYAPLDALGHQAILHLRVRYRAPSIPAERVTLLPLERDCGDDQRERIPPGRGEPAVLPGAGVDQPR